MRRALALVVVLAAACGGEKGGTPAPGSTPRQEAQPAPAAPQAAAPTTPGTTYDVKMDLQKGKYFFDPASLTIKPGDMVRFVNVHGGPHNVQFKKDRIPAGAEAVLDGTMPERIQSLTGPFIKDSMATYVVSFANAPAGTYAYACQPHEALGMVGTITVAP